MELQSSEKMVRLQDIELNHMTMRTYLLISFMLLFNAGVIAQLAVVNPAEFEKNEGVLLVWDYSNSRDSITANIARHAQKEGKVWIIYYPGQAPADTAQIKDYLLSRGVTVENLFFIPGWTETLWIRDFGPLSAYASFGKGLRRFMYDPGYSAYGRPKDDSIPHQLARQWEWPPRNLGLELEGGNLIFDGLWRGFGSKRIWEQNPGLTPDEIRLLLMDRFNLMDFIFLDNLNNSGGGIWKHVDMYMKVIDYETILVSSYPDFLPDFPVIESIVGLLENTPTYFGKPYKVIRIPAPPKANGEWATTQNDEMRTYTNSLIINSTVIVPSYDLPDWDNQAKAIYEQNMPGYTIEMVDSRMLTILGGAIHCITKEVPAAGFNRIIHEKVTQGQAFEKDFVIGCLASSDTTVLSMWLYYKMNDQETYTKVPVHLTCPLHFGVIENLQPDDTISYYLELNTESDTITYPLTAPEGSFTFWFNPVGLSEGITQNNDLKVYPNPASESIVIETIDWLESPMQLTISNLAGQIVFSVVLNETKIEINPRLREGVYIINVSSQDRAFRSKLVIRK